MKRGDGRRREEKEVTWREPTGGEERYLEEIDGKRRKEKN